MSWKMKWMLTLVLGAIALLGFMVRLPGFFRHMDKELHSLFYFGAAAYLNLMFAGRNLLWHALIFGALFLAGISIEYAQEFSNQLLHARIHGRFDPEDVRSNLKGLVWFSVLWIPFLLVKSGIRYFSRQRKTLSDH